MMMKENIIKLGVFGLTAVLLVVFLFITTNKENEVSKKADQFPTNLELLSDKVGATDGENNEIKETLKTNVNKEAFSTKVTSIENNVEDEAPQFLRENKTLNPRVIKDSLESQNFQTVLDLLSEDLSETELTRKQNLSDTLNNIPELSSLTYEHSCGKGVCAVLVPSVESSMIVDLSNSIIDSIDTPVVFSRNVNSENGYSEFRLIFDGNPDNKAEMTFKPGEKF